MAIGKILKYGIKAVKAARKAKRSKNLDARMKEIYTLRDKADIKKFGVTDPKIKELYKLRTKNKLKKYGYSPAKPAKKTKRSYKSMNPIEKAVTAAKISGRTMKSAGKIKHSEMHRPTAKFLNRSYVVAGTTLGVDHLVNRNKKKKK